MKQSQQHPWRYLCQNCERVLAFCWAWPHDPIEFQILDPPQCVCLEYPFDFIVDYITTLRTVDTKRVFFATSIQPDVSPRCVCPEFPFEWLLELRSKK